MTPRIQKRGKSVFQIAIIKLQFKNTLRILKCGPAHIEEHKKRIDLRLFFSKDTQRAFFGVP